MIKILGKFTRDGKIVAWRISDDGIESNIAYRAIYHEFYFQSMIDSGYRFRNYDGDVYTSDGFPISDVVESSEYLSDSELIDLIDLIEQGGMLEEKDIVQYFDRKVNVEFVSVEKPVSVNIGTREEFIGYIDTISKANKSNIRKFSTRPVNAFTAPDALFTIEELVSNKDNAKLKFANVYSNMSLSHVDDIEELMSEHNVDLDTMSPTQAMVAILKSYFQWGIPGLNAKITKVRFDYEPDTLISRIGESLDNHAMLKYGIKRNSDTKMFCEDIIDGEDYYSLTGSGSVDISSHIGPIAISNLKQEEMNSDYTIVPYGFKNILPRIVIDILSDDGISATFVADVNEAHLYRGTTEITSPLSMFKFRTIDNVVIPLSRIIQNGVNYISDSTLINAYIEEMIDRATVVPKYDTSFGLMSGVGMSPFYIPMYMNKMIKEGAPTYVDVANVSEFCSLHRYCSNTFRDGFSNHIIEKYGTGDDDFADKPLIEQLEFINEEISNLEGEGKYLVKPEVGSNTIRIADSAYNEWYDEYYANEVNNVNFVMSILNGEQNVGQLAIGMKLDNYSNHLKIFNIIYSAMCAAKNKYPNISCAEFLTTYIDEFVDESIVFGTRKQTALGCIKDIINCRSNMSIESNVLLYITKVFRENSNAELNGLTRHWGFECLCFDKSSGTIGSQIFKSIYDQIINDLASKGLNNERFIAGDLASSILIKAALSKEEATPIDGICYIEQSTTLSNGNKYTVKVRLAESFYNKVRKGRMFVRKYSSCYDFCENQINAANLKCDYYCVNASVNPWCVTPREGFSIMEYNIFVNYFKIEELYSSFPASVVEKINASGAKVIPCLREDYQTHSLFESMASIFTRAEEVKLAQEGFFLERNEFEDLDTYIARTTFDIKSAKSENKAVKNTVLKSDVQLDMFKPYIHIDDVGKEPTYYEEYSGPITNRYVTNMAPRKIYFNWTEEETDTKLLTTSERSVCIERVKFSDIPFEKKLWNSDLCYGKFDVNANVFLSKGKLFYNKNEYKVIKDLTEKDFEELCNLNIAIQLDSKYYIIKTINGLLKVGV